MRNQDNVNSSFEDVHDAFPPWELNAGPEALAFRSAMRKFVGGVTIITTLHESRPWGMTVSAFSPVCMDPPILIACVNRDTVTASDITRDPHFAVNILSEEQVAVSQFCSRPREDKFIEDFVFPSAAVPDRIQMPVLRNSLITFDCRANTTFVVNSHLVLLAQVRAVLAPSAKKPLLYGEGQYMQGVSMQRAMS
ncbi:flavin reductase [Ensifer adhaerens]|jgi:flavin reductase (DIM6/NTAB) family NADH-FMN oxidoreductase RutF|uniref:flavin reductase family protein n=1 Tax=Ensifer canadensis TaxID=555315 RepID=UPI00148F7A77|nr:flavin reductase family protein [Ensifer canadensis]NOV20649.1 flavin reductase [Ensifer canadensis]